MRIQIYSQTQKNIWDNFVRSSKNGTFLFLRDYMDYHCNYFLDQSLLIWDSKDQLIALLPANREDDVLVSHRGLTYGGFVINETMKTPKMVEIFEEVLAFLKQRAFQRLIYKTVPSIYHTIPAEEDRYALFLCNAHLVRRAVITAVKAGCRPKFQERRVRAIKRAQAHGLRVIEYNNLASYWELLTDVIWQNHRTKPVHSLEEINLLYAKFPEHIKLFGCIKEQTLLAGVLVYESNNVARAQYIAANQEGRQCGALDLIFNCLLTDIYTNKPFFDFGTSDEADGQRLNIGLIEQKEGFGARAIMHDHYEIQLANDTLGLSRSISTSGSIPAIV